ncbi:hypothetical protein [uncultured Roseivirga sp.]|uniref:hypothetical protein n=1 Tax=uncultured Roseivirga sp. TaxID=543088 RepID=UPI0030D74A6A|tara:strand:+ start:2765 stop:3301 length:537 start_codon:yes stop_codon:yes gene_type:complete
MKYCLFLLFNFTITNFCFSQVTGLQLDDKPKRVLQEILNEAGLTKAMVSSYKRTPLKQVQIMYNKCEDDGLQAAYNLYSSHADKVLDVYRDNQGKSKDVIIALMKNKLDDILQELGSDRKTMMHVGNTVNYAFDVAPSSITNRTAFETAVKNHSDVVQARFFKPDGAEAAYHIEVSKN